MTYIGLINNEIKLYGSDVEAVKDGAFACGLTLDSIEQTDKEVITACDGKMYFKGEEPEKPLDDLKAAKREEINKARDAAEQGGFEYLGKVFDSDPVSCQRIALASQTALISKQAGQEFSVEWTCQDNSKILLSADDTIGLSVALTQWSNICHVKASELKALVDQATTQEEVDAINWELDLSSEQVSEQVEEIGNNSLPVEENSQVETIGDRLG